MMETKNMKTINAKVSLNCEDDEDLCLLLKKMVILSSENENKVVVATINGIKLYADFSTNFEVFSSYYEDGCKQLEEVNKIKEVLNKLHLIFTNNSTNVDSLMSDANDASDRMNENFKSES